MSEVIAGLLLVIAGATCIGVQWMLFDYASRQDNEHWLNRPIFSKKRRP